MQYFRRDADASRLVKRTTIAARLFYHTAMCLLSQINPIITDDVEEVRQNQLMHAHQICGIVAHCKDRYVFPSTFVYRTY